MEELSFSLTDIIYVIILFLFAIRGGLKGFIYELFSFVSFLLPVFISVQFSFLIEPNIANVVDKQEWVPFISFFLFFFVFYLLLSLFSFSTLRILRYQQSPSLSSFLGFILGFAKGGLICGLLAYFAIGTNLFSLQERVQDGFFYPYLERVLPLFKLGLSYIPPI